MVRFREMRCFYGVYRLCAWFRSFQQQSRKLYKLLYPFSIRQTQHAWVMFPIGLHFSCTLSQAMMGFFHLYYPTFCNWLVWLSAWLCLTSCVISYRRLVQHIIYSIGIMSTVWTLQVPGSARLYCASRHKRLSKSNSYTIRTRRTRSIAVSFTEFEKSYGNRV